MQSVILLVTWPDMIYGSSGSGVYYANNLQGRRDVEREMNSKNDLAIWYDVRFTSINGPASQMRDV